MDGAGVTQLVEKELAEGTLVEVLQPYGGRSRPYSLLYPHGRLLPSRVRVFIDFMIEQTERLQAAEAAATSKARRPK